MKFRREADLLKTKRIVLFAILLIAAIFAASRITLSSDDPFAACAPILSGVVSVPGYPNQWIFQASGIHQMYARDPALTETMLAGCHIYYVRERTFRPHDVDSPFPANQPVRQYASLEQFKQDIAYGAIPDDIRIVMYDPESWEYTPVAEQLRSVESIREFGRLAHAHGFTVITIPHDSFLSRIAQRDGVSTAVAFDELDIAGVAAEAGDITAVQTQNRQFDPIVFRNYVAKMAARAREVNPDVLVYSELSTSPYDYTESPVVRRQATPDELLAAYNAVRDLIDGFYVSVNTPGEAWIAIAFLTEVQQEIALAAEDQSTEK